MRADERQQRVRGQLVDRLGDPTDRTVSREHDRGDLSVHAIAHLVSASNNTKGMNQT